MASNCPAWFRGDIDHEFLRDVAEISSVQQVRFTVSQRLYQEVVDFSGEVGHKGSVMRTLLASFAIAKKLYQLTRNGGKIIYLSEKDGEREAVELFFDFKPSTEI